MKSWCWNTLDHVTFFLFRRLRVLPMWVYAWVSVQRDRRLRPPAAGVDVDDFYEDDEPAENVRAAFDRGEKHLTARPVQPKRLHSMFSFRADPEDVAQLRLAAMQQGVSNSELIRRAVVSASKPVGFRCEHMSVTCGPGMFSFTCPQGCEMRPMHAALTG